MKIHEKEEKIRYLKEIIEAIEDDELQYLWISHKRDISSIEYNETPEFVYGDNYEITINMAYEPLTNEERE